MYGAHCLSILSGGACTDGAKASLSDNIPQIIVVQQPPLHGYAVSATWKCWDKTSFCLSLHSYMTSSSTQSIMYSVLPHYYMYSMHMYICNQFLHVYTCGWCQLAHTESLQLTRPGSEGTIISPQGGSELGSNIREQLDYKQQYPT